MQRPLLFPEKTNKGFSVCSFLLSSYYMYRDMCVYCVLGGGVDVYKCCQFVCCVCVCVWDISSFFPVQFVTNIEEGMSSRQGLRSIPLFGEKQTWTRNYICSKKLAHCREPMVLCLKPPRPTLKKILASIQYTLYQRKSIFPDYNMKCSAENVILRGIFHVVSCFPLHFLWYRGNLGYLSSSVCLRLSEKPVESRDCCADCHPHTTC